MDRQNLKRILFTSVGRRVELIQSFQRASMKNNIPVWIVGADMSETAPALYYCDEAVRVPRISDESYIPALLSICREKKIELLIPTIDTDLLKLSQARDRFEEIGTKVFISDVDKISLCRDKRLTGDFFTSVGLLSPITVDDVSDYTGDYPCFIKPLNGSSSINAYRADDVESLRAFAEQIGEGNYIIQNYIAGTEYTIDIFCGFDRRPIFITPRVRNAVRSGEVLKTTITQDERMIAEAKRIVEGFRPVGMICAQLIRETATGLDYFIEINPRFGGGAPLSIAAGADACSMTLKMLMGETSEYVQKAAKNGNIYSRFDQCVCVSTSEVGSHRVTSGSEVTSYINKMVRDGLVKGVIFDLDDTLYSEYDYVLNGFREVSKLFDDPEETYEFMVEAFKRGEAPIDEAIRHFGKDEGAYKRRCVSAYRNQTPEKLPAYAWGIELIKWLGSQDIPTGIITDGRVEGQVAKLHATGIDRLIGGDMTIITDALGGKQFRKPCDIAYRMLALKMGLEPCEIIYIGNNPTKDFKGAKAIGMRTLFFDNPLCIHQW